MQIVRRRLTTAACLLIACSAARAQAASFDTLYSFSGSDGSRPTAPLARGSSGELYGTTFYGGAHSNGTVFVLTPPAVAGDPWTEKVVYSFGGGADGAMPIAGVTVSPTGLIYGTTYAGGTSGAGTVFVMKPPATPSGTWAKKTIYSFTGGDDGANPYGRVVIGRGGVLFGTAALGGSSGYGVVFRLAPPSAAGGAWTQTVLHTFAQSGDGGYPYSGVVIGQGGVLYGTTSVGGNTPMAAGVVYALKPPGSPGGSWTESIIYNFSGGADGGIPECDLAISPAGILFGTTTQGGTSGLGTTFLLKPPGTAGGAWTQRVLHSFAGGSDGATPIAGLTLAAGDVLFGTTLGTLSAPDYGTVFSLTPPSGAGKAWTHLVLHNFSGGADQGSPWSGLVMDSAGVLYGTTSGDGISAGTVFSVTP